MVYVMLTYASTGATVVNQCLAGSKKVVFLSELNPLGGGTGSKGTSSPRTVKSQLKEWYGIEVDSDEFCKGIQEAELITHDKKLTLIIRDWSYVNFTPHPANNGNPPGQFLILEELSGEVEVIAFAFIRHPIDVWISRNFPPLSNFVEEYGRFLQEAKRQNCPIFRYENFVRHPDLELQKMLDFMDIKENVKALVDHYQQIDTVSGSTTHQTRGANQGQIAPLPRKVIFLGSWFQLVTNQNMKSLCKEWEYSPYYFTSLSHILQFLYKKISSIPKIIRMRVSRKDSLKK